MALAGTSLGRKGGGEPLQRPQQKGKVFPSGREQGLVGVVQQGPKGVHPGPPAMTPAAPSIPIASQGNQGSGGNGHTH